MSIDCVRIAAVYQRDDGKQQKHNSDELKPKTAYTTGELMFSSGARYSGIQELNLCHWLVLCPSCISLLASVLALCPEGTSLLQSMIIAKEDRPPKGPVSKSPGTLKGWAWSGPYPVAGWGQPSWATLDAFPTGKGVH